MASKDQVRKNMRDVNSAWGHFQGLVQSQLPGLAVGIDAWAKIMNTKRRYT